MRVPKEHSHGVFSQPPFNYTPTEIAALPNDVRICKSHLIDAPNWKLHPVATDPLTKAIIDGALKPQAGFLLRKYPGQNPKETIALFISQLKKAQDKYWSDNAPLNPLTPQPGRKRKRHSGTSSSPQHSPAQEPAAVQGTAPSPANDLKGLRLTMQRTKKELDDLQAQAKRDKEQIALLEAQVELLRERKKKNCRYLDLRRHA
jgi:hypothetical protein